MPRSHQRRKAVNLIPHFSIAMTLFAASHVLGVPVPAQTAQSGGKSAAASGGGFHQSMSEKAGDPLAPIIQFQILETIARVDGGEGWANQLEFQPVIPIPKSLPSHSARNAGAGRA